MDCPNIPHPPFLSHFFFFFFLPKTKSYVRDTQHFISRLKALGKIPEGAILVTLDVSSLYTNIPNHEGLLAVAAHLRQDRTKDPITPYILQLLKLVLHSMNFTFNDQHYLQIGGTAMGTALAPNYANLFMDRFETKAIRINKSLNRHLIIDQIPYTIWALGIL